MCRPNGSNLVYLAHSENSEQGIPAQSYSDHVIGVFSLAKKNCAGFSCSLPTIATELENIVMPAAVYHDLGKLAEENQSVLSNNEKRYSLPLDHSDAGSALFSKYGEATPSEQLVAWLIHSHHKGLLNFYSEESQRGSMIFRSEDNRSVSDTEKYLQKYINIHSSLLNCKIYQNRIRESELEGIEFSVFLRQALSCLVDADHTDTAINYDKYLIGMEAPSLRAEERLNALDRYVNSLNCGNLNESKRDKLREEMYLMSRNVNCIKSIYWCDSPVGTGKTTAIMANLLKMAIIKNLKRIFVILPFTNIINQSVDVYRKALVLDGENPETVVAAIHHRAEYDGIATRQLSTLWNAPIIVTTAAQFFETMAAAKPSALRKLHNLPNSGVFIDESHTALPIKLWPLAWFWIKEYAKNWHCHFVLASGSMNKFWELKEFDEEQPDIPAMLPKEFRSKLNIFEKERITFLRKLGKMNEDELCDWLLTLQGPRLVILNTVQSAAVVAKKMAGLVGRKEVEHLSTALTPLDREIILEKIRKRLENKNDTNWTLIATSCVEAGVDFSFRTGVREIASLVSLLQIAGRVRRNEEKDYTNSVVWTIELNFDKLLKQHPAFKESSEVLIHFMEGQEEISPSLCTRALKREIDKLCSFKEQLREKEKNCEFEKVAEDFRVIDSDTVTMVIGDDLKSKLEKHEKVDWKDIQNGSVQIWANKADKFRLSKIIGYSDIYFWPYRYDNFLGYMAGLLENEKVNIDGFSVF